MKKKETKQKKILVKTLTKLLNEGEVNFSFTKKDGSERVTKATRNYDLIPEDHKPTNETEESTNLRFFDLDKEGWRSLSKDTKKVTLIK
jgi:hypothetical protein